ncbi:hypothetical protein [Clostridium amazonitimonense]|uniref:hypothetical protein n=1 Tax=Clostridium amazonitimonense TaxID=1499689 RepID=UPI00164D2CC3|nr:hypothetical protein [Clostridium amazonitimonense]
MEQIMPKQNTFENSNSDDSNTFTCIVIKNRLNSIESKNMGFLIIIPTYNLDVFIIIYFK